ncbi:hypothetical protein GVN20_29070 [Runella sp. CRIBMP]|jgi:hypothetical protein|uniref:Uncharacterized protein n=1 Tax=Runella salmonicolor TaxID=2950278 RepID=A0ABT1FHM0_9BACT|nr:MULTISPECIES: hypothetical protein [Runella]MCP1381236.1 hypothetical protein [Runella salmonicolor]NBB23438.1 hypothetical protein [Runella sp. CRIBMP]
MNKSFFITCILLIAAHLSFAQAHIETEGEGSSIEPMSVVIGVVIGLVVGYLVGSKMGKK